MQRTVKNISLTKQKARIEMWAFCREENYFLFLVFLFVAVFLFAEAFFVFLALAFLRLTMIEAGKEVSRISLYAIMRSANNFVRRRNKNVIVYANGKMLVKNNFSHMR